jgi:hypothetical protein
MIIIYVPLLGSHIGIILLCLSWQPATCLQDLLSVAVGMQAVEDLLTQGIMADATRGRLKSRVRWHRRIRDRE